MRPRHTVRWLAISALTALFVPGVVSGAIYTPASLSPPPDSAGANPANPIVNVFQNLPVGDMMTATLTHNGVVIMNMNGTTPTYSATVGAGTQGASFTIPGIANGLTVNDLDQTHSAPGVPNGMIQIGAFQAGNMTPLGTYVFGAGPQSVPDFFSTPTGLPIFYGVDLVTWANHAFTVGSTFSINNGTNASLPGYLFSTTMETAGAGGWNTTTPYTGPVTIDSSHDLISSVPEPASLVLAGTAGAIGLACYGRHRRLRPGTRATVA